MRKYTETDWEEKKFSRETGSSGLQIYVLKRLRQLDNVVPVKVMQANEDGVSDILLCVNGRYVAIELKVGNNKPTKKQLSFLDKVLSAGGVVGVAYTWGDVKKILRMADYAFAESEKQSQE